MQWSVSVTWSHYIELLKIDDPLERSFYEKECEEEHWGVRELKRQMKSMLFHRLALSTDKQEILKLASEGQIIEKPEDILKEPYVFEFTGLPQLPVYEEGDLEEALVNNLSMFFLLCELSHNCSKSEKTLLSLMKNTGFRSVAAIIK